MKRFLLSTVIALMALCASAAIGDTFSVGKLNYQVTSNGTTEDYPQVTVTGLSAEGKAISSLNLQIQSTVLYNGTRYRVTEIGAYAFYAQKNLVTLWVRWGILRIKNNAFQSCTNLTQARLASSVDYIESLAFNNCSSLKYVFCANDYIKDSNYASNCMPNNSGMVLLVSNTAKNTVERAKGIAAFKNFATIYRNYEAFDFAFTDGGYYVASNLPDEKPNKNRHGVFKLVGLNSSNTEYAPTASSYTVDGYTYDLAEVTYNACESYSNLKTVDLSRLSYLRAINDYAFKGCSALTTIKLNSSTSLSIYSEAFANCTSLTTLNLTSNVYAFSASAVNGCSNLKTITVSTLNKHLCDVNGIVYSKDKTKLVRCPPGHNTTIFNHSSFPSTLKEIGSEAFATCKKIQKVHIPYGVKSIRMCFDECTGLTTLQIPSSATDFGYVMFGFIPNLTYFYCNLSTPPSGMPYGPYSSAPRLTLYVPDEAIEAYKNATYWSTWKYIKGGAFDVTTNDAMETLRYTIHSNKAETINGNSYDGRAMLVYAPDPTTVYSQTYAVPDYVRLPNGKKYAVTAINSNVCSGGMRASATLTLGANVDSIFSNAFKGKTMLTGLKLNSKLTYIGVNAFYDCRIANDLALPYGFKKLSSGAFYNNSFKRFLIPGSLISLGHTCLARNNYLEELVINDPYWARSTSWDLTKIPTSCKLYVPVGSVEAYKNNEKWGKLKVMAGSYDFTYNNANPNRTMFHMTVTSSTPLTVDGMTYAGKAKYVYHPANMTLESPTTFDCTNSEMDMTNGGSKKYLMTEFGDSALIWCEQLTNVRVERMEHLERIGNSAFRGTNITQFTVPASCSHIGNMAFSACSKLSELMLMRNQNRTYGRLFYQLNATNFNCYINWKDHYNLYLDVSKWPTSPYRPECKDQLNGWVQINDGSTVSTFVVYHPVDWEASGLNAYIVDGYDKNKKIASTMKMGRTSTANGVLIEGYKQNVIYKLKRPITEPTNPGNYLQGTVTSENLDQYKVAYVFDKKDKYFWKPSSGYRAEAGSAFLQLTNTQAGNTTKVYIDRWSNATGDINGDGEVNVSDVTALINKILGSSTYSDAVCDINGDGEINVSDVTALINLILK